MFIKLYPYYEIVGICVTSCAVKEINNTFKKDILWKSENFWNIYYSSKVLEDVWIIKNSRIFLVNDINSFRLDIAISS